MELKEAYKILEADPSISDDELKSVYKKLALKYHPDRCEEKDKDKFKIINSAYQRITDQKEHPEKYETRSPFSGNHQGGGGFGFNIQDIIDQMRGQQGNQQQQISHDTRPINVYTKISFKESVVGVDREISYKKNIKCEKCDGNGKEAQSNGCKSCNGFGRIIQNQQGMSYSSTCNKCYGRNIIFKNCTPCNAKGIQSVDTTLNIHIPPGTPNVLRMRGAGNFAGTVMFGDAYADTYLNIEIEKDKDLRLEGADVLSNLNITLLEALTGCEKEVRTIFDTRKIIIPAKTKNKDVVKIDGCGIKNQNGKQIINLNIDYPENTEALIKFLNRKKKEK